jgi:threonine dehydratase
MEIMKTFPDENGPDYVFICCGGGGMLAGIGAYIKALKPGVQIIGVEAADAAGMTASLAADKVVTLPSVGLFADGAAVRTIGKETLRVCRQVVDEMVTVSTDEICASIKLGFNDTRNVLEPAGALGIAGLVKYVRMHKLEGKNIVAITSGANMDFDRLRFVSERADNREVVAAVELPERPGSFLEMYKLLCPPRNMTGFSYRYEPNSNANIMISFQTGIGATAEEDEKVREALMKDHGFGYKSLENNEMAKAHGRHISGGRAPMPDAGEIEMIYRFEYPEAPGALNNFLNALYSYTQQHWTISLLHYRSHGHDFGRVLVGMRIPEIEKEDFISFVKTLDYKAYPENENIFYTTFLQ